MDKIICAGFCANEVSVSDVSGFAPRKNWCPKCKDWWTKLCEFADVLDKEDIIKLRDQNPKQSTYFIQCHDFVKIGGTSDQAGNRLSTLQVGCPYPLTLLKFIPGLDETKTREKFKHLLVRGEWYKLTEEILQFIDD